MTLDYSGHIPEPIIRPVPLFDKEALREAVSSQPSKKSPIQTLLDDISRQVQESREEILKKLIEDPGIIATFENDFVVEFGPLEVRTLDSFPGQSLDEYRMEVTQNWRIRRRKEEDGRPGLGRDSGGEARAD